MHLNQHLKDLLERISILNMSRVYFIGDIYTNSGPSNANKQILNSIKENYKVAVNSKKQSLRLIELIFKVWWANKIIICSKSKFNKWIIKLAKIFNREIIYIFHGISSFEDKVNNSLEKVKIDQNLEYDNFIIDNCNKCIFVSIKLKELAIELFGKRDHYYYIYNVVDFDNKDNLILENLKSIDVISVGGGVPIKKNLVIAKAINSFNVKINYYVVGKESRDGKKIKEYEFVKYIEWVSHEELLKLMQQTKIYVQNSIFESFGLSIIEALYSGCSILFPKNCGCLELFESLTGSDIIENSDDQDEIKIKITNLLENPNNQRLIKGFNKEKVSMSWQAKKLKEIINL